MDPRDREAEFGKWYESFDEKRMVFIVLHDDGEDLDQEIEIPAVYSVCELCDGHGKFVNPSIDAHGIAADEFYEDPDFAESYFRGDYDVPCYRCGGQRVEPVVDEDRATLEQKKIVEGILRDRADFVREVEAERRFGC